MNVRLNGLLAFVQGSSKTLIHVFQSEAVGHQLWLGASRALAFGGGVGIVLLFFSLFFWTEMYRK